MYIRKNMDMSGSSWREEPGKLHDSSLRRRLKKNHRSAGFPAVREIIMQKNKAKRNTR